jgi:hypothetical protein
MTTPGPHCRASRVQFSGRPSGAPSELEAVGGLEGEGLDFAIGDRRQDSLRPRQGICFVGEGWAVSFPMEMVSPVTSKGTTRGRNRGVQNPPPPARRLVAING